jgi:hypothetical protein
MTRHYSGVIVLVAAALLLAVPADQSFAQSGPKETGGGGRGGERGSPGAGAPSMGGGGNAGSAMPTGGGMAPAPSSGSTGGNYGSGSVSAPSGSAGSPAYGGAGRPSGDREPRSSSGPTTEVSPWFSRPRGNSPSTGTATERTTPAGSAGPATPGAGYGGHPVSGSRFGYGYDPSGYYGNYGYYGWGLQPFWWGGFGYGSYYDPFWSGYGGYSGYGYGYGSGYGSGYGYGGDYGRGYGWGTPSGFGSPQGATGGIRLKVKPAQATVYVDGYYAGRVDDFDGMFQKLRLEAGPHRIEISAPGLKSIAFDVNIRAGENINFQGELEIIK